MQGKKRFIKLTAAEEAALEEGRKNGDKATFRQRCHYILLSHQGKTITDIADIFKVQRQSVANWYNRYEANGINGLRTTKGQGRPSILRVDNEAESKQVEEIVNKSSQSLKQAINNIEQELGKKVSKRTLKRYLKKKIGDGNVLEKTCPTSQQKKN